MRVKVRGVIPAHAQDTAALGLPRFRTPERGRVLQWPGRQRDASRQASLEQITTAHTLSHVGMYRLHFHGPPPCGLSCMRLTAPVSPSLSSRLSPLPQPHPATSPAPPYAPEVRLPVQPQYCARLP